MLVLPISLCVHGCAPGRVYLASFNPFEQLEGFPDNYLQDNPSQEEAAIALLCRKPPRAKNEKQAAYAKLIRSGYSADIAAEATKKWYETKNGG